MNPSRPPFALTDLHAPMRDILRGVSGAVEMAEGALKPIARFVPQPVNTVLLNAVRAMADATRAKRTADVDVEKLKHASSFLLGQDARFDGAKACAKTLGFTWDYLHQENENGLREMFSESVAEAVIHRLDYSQPQLRPAKVLQTILKSGAIGLFPGTPLASSTLLDRDTIPIIFAGILWILTERAKTADEELRLLEAAFALSRASQADKIDIANLKETNQRLLMLATHL